MCIGEARQSGRPGDTYIEDTWKPVHAGGHIAYNLEARQCGRPTTRMYTGRQAGEQARMQEGKNKACENAGKREEGRKKRRKAG